MATDNIATLGIKVDPRGAVTGASKAKRAILGIGTAAKRVKSSIFSLQGALAGAGAGALLTSIIKTAAGVESLKVRLKFLTGSTEDAAKAFETMNKFAAKVPFSLEDIERASPSLLTIAENVEELNELLEITGDIAAVSGLAFDETAMQLQRAMGAGIASADMFRERGISAFLGFQQGVSYSASETKKMIIAMFRDGTTSAKGATTEMAGTFQGKVSMMEDAWRELKLEIANTGVFDEVTSSIVSITDALKDPATIAAVKSLGIAIKDSFQWVIDNKELLLMILGAKAGASVGKMLGGTKGAIVGGALGAGGTGLGLMEEEQDNLEATRATNAAMAERRRILEDNVKLAKLAVASATDPSYIQLIQQNIKDQEIKNQALMDQAQIVVNAKKALFEAEMAYKKFLGVPTAVLPSVTIKIKKQNKELEKSKEIVHELGDEWDMAMDLIDDQFAELDMAHARMIAGMSDGTDKIKSDWQEAAEAMKESMSDTITDSIMQFKSLGDTVKSIGNMIARMIIQKSIADPIATGISGAIGKLDFGFGTSHTGGIIGKDTPKFHNGGVVGGLGSKEVPAILEKGEMVLTREQQKAVGNNVVNVTYSPQVNALDPRTAATVIAQNAPTVVGIIRQAMNRNGRAIAI